MIIKNDWFPYSIIEEPLLSFHAEDKFTSKKKIEGLFKYGPLDNSIQNNFLKPINPIKIGLILPQNKKGIYFNYLKYLNSQIDFNNLKESYICPYKGFREIYGVSLSLEVIEYLEISEIKKCLNEKDILGLYVNKIKNFKKKSYFNLLILIIPSEFEEFILIKKEDYYFHLHDSLKLFCAQNNIKTQIIREVRLPDINNKRDLAKNIWWLSGAIYSKSGGLLYRLSQTNERVLYIGISYSLNQINNNHRILIGVAELFDERGNNIRLDLFSRKDFTGSFKNPYLSEEASRNIFQKILNIYRIAKIYPPSKIVIYKNTPFNNDEIKGIRQALSSINRIELLFIQNDCFFRALRLDNYLNRKGHLYPVFRGTVMKVDNRNFLCWTSGNIKEKNLNYFQEQRHIPSPLLIKRYLGSDTMEEVATDVLKLTKMNWNNLQYYNRLPVTLDFASTISRITKLAKDFNYLPNDFRFYI